MSEEATGKSGKTWLYVVGLLVGLPLIYVLSTGPMVVLNERKVIPDSVVETTYGPLLWFVEKTGTYDAFEGYVRIWFRLTGTVEP